MGGELSALKGKLCWKAYELGVDVQTIRYYRQELEGAHIFIQTYELRIIKNTPEFV